MELVLTGDLMMNRPLRGPGDPAPATEAIYELMRAGDITFVNLEVPLTRRGTPADKLITFCADPDLAADLARIGADVVTVANNHALDYGPEGLLDTLAALDTARVAWVGGGRDVEEALQHRVLAAKGSRVAFVGLATTLPPGFAAGSGRPGIAPIRVFTRFVVDSVTLDEQPGTAPYVETEMSPPDVEAALAAVRRAKAGADHVVVGIHWGVPHGFVAAFQDDLATYQRPLGRALVDAGADVVVGNHAHVLHGVEFHRGRPILYCLGNFVFHRLARGTPVGLNRNYPPYRWGSLRSRVNRLTCLARVTLGAGDPAVELIPALINDSGEPELARGDVAREVFARVAAECEPLGARLVEEGERARVLPA